MDKKIVTVSVVDLQEHRGEWPPTNIAEFSDWLQSKINSIPEEFRGNAEIEIGTHAMDFDYTALKIEIYYTRPETDEEFAQRNSEEAKRAAREEEAQARKMYEQLRKRFGG